MSSSTNPGDRSAAEIEREVAQTRARLSGTVEELRERVSPGQLAEQAMEWLRGSGGKEFVGNLGSAVRDNPIPVLLVAAGLGWLAFGGGGRGGDRLPAQRGQAARYPEGYESDVGYPGVGYGRQGHAEGSSDAGMMERGGAAVGQAWEGAKSAVASAADSVTDTARELGGSVAGTAQTVAEGATATARQVAERAGEAWNAAGESASRLGRDARDHGRDAGRGIAEAIEGNPLLLGGIGLAIGAALGALIPATDAEDRLMGSTRDRMAGQLGRMAGDAYGQAREVAGEQLSQAKETLGAAYDRTRDRAAEGGLSPREGGGALGAVARDLREAVERTAQQAGEAARATLAKPGDDQVGNRPTPPV